MVYLAKGGFWFTFGHIISTIVTFGTAVTFAHFIPSDVYGTYKFILSTVGILAISTLSGMGSMLSQAVARGMEGSLFEIIKTKIRWGFAGATCSLGLAIYYYFQGNTQLMIAFIIATAFIPFMDSFNVYQDYLQGKKRFDVSIPYFSISQVLSAAIMIGVVFVTQNLYAIFLTYLLSWTLTRLFFFLRTIRKFPPNDKTDPHTIPYGKHSSASDVIATLIGSLDQILIFHFLGPVSLAVYSFAIAPISQLVTPFRNIPILAMPKLAARPVPEINAMLKKRILTAFGVAAAVIIVYVLLAPFFFKIFFPKYISSIGISRLYALSMLFSIPNTILGPAVSAKITYLPKKMFYLWNIPGLTSTIFILIFIQKIGVESVALGRIILVAISFIMGYQMWRYILKKDKEKIPATSDIQPVL